MSLRAVARGEGGGSGSVSQIDTGTGLTGGPITDTGTISIADDTPNTLAGFDGTGDFSNVTVGTGLNLSAGVLTAAASAPNFDDIGTGTNTTATMTVGTGATLSASGSGTITATAAPLSGISGLGANVATFLATPSSANLAAAVTDETGSGSLVFATSPTLVTPALGTPSSGTLTSCTGLPLSTGVTGQLPLANGGTGANLTDPGADRILFWDDSAGVVTWLTAGSGLTITDTTITASGSAPSFTDITSGTNTTAAMVVGTGASLGVSGSGTIAATTSVALATPRTIGGTSFDGTANIVPATITVADTTDTTCSVALFESATGDLAPKTDGALTYNATTGALAATTFNGVALTTAGSATDFLNAAGNYVAAGGGSPGGSNTQVQYNNSSAFGGITGATTNGTVMTLTSGLATTAFSPSSNDAATLGTGSLGWSDGYFATGAALDFGAGNVTWTHAAGVMTLAGREIISSNSATAFVVGPNGATNPAFTVACNTASADCGLTVTGGTNVVTLNATGTDTNIAMQISSKGSSDLRLETAATNAQIEINPAGTNRYLFDATYCQFSPTTSSTAGNPRFIFASAADSSLTAGTEALAAYWNLSTTRTHASNTTITTQRDFLVLGTPHAFASSGGTITNYGTVSITPGTGGTNATLTHNASIYIPTASVANTTNSYALRIAAPTGATNNYCAELTGNVILDGELRIDGTPTSDHSANGPTTRTFNAGATIAAFEVVYQGASFEWLLADASAASTSGPVMIGVALEAGTDNSPLLVALSGSFVRDDTWNWSPGAIYVSETTGALTQTAPSAAGSIVRVVGYAVSADVMHVCPSGAWVENP